MKTVVVLLAMALVGVAAIDVMADATQTRPDHVPRESRSELVLDVRIDGYRPGVEAAANNLWAACSGTVGGRTLVEPGLVAIAPGRYRFQLEPGLGEHQQRRVVGCLQDLTIERVLGNVQSVRFLTD